MMTMAMLVVMVMMIDDDDIGNDYDNDDKALVVDMYK